MGEPTPVNDNRYREYGCLDPDRYYVRDYLDEMMAHFKECRINSVTISDAMEDALLTLQTGDPAADSVDENAMWANLLLLWPVQKRYAALIDANEEALRRAERQRAEASEPSPA